MAGIEILSEQIMYNTFLPGWCAGIGIIFALFGLPIGLVILSESDIKWPGHILMALTFIGCFMMLFGLISNKNSIDYIEYKATIEDSVSMNEFLDRYEILDQEGKIYTIREKE